MWIALWMALTATAEPVSCCATGDLNTVMSDYSRLVKALAKPGQARPSNRYLYAMAPVLKRIPTGSMPEDSARALAAFREAHKRLLNADDDALRADLDALTTPLHVLAVNDQTGAKSWVLATCEGKGSWLQAAGTKPLPVYADCKATLEE